MQTLERPQALPSSIEIMRRDLWVPDAVEAYKPKSDLGKFIKLCAQNLPDPEMAIELIERFSRTISLHSALYATVYRGHDGIPWDELDRFNLKFKIEYLGLVGEKVITNNGVGYLVDAWQNSVELENQKYHGIGTGSTAENQTDSALVTELTTEYNPDSTRATGSLTEGASANIFRTVGTNTLDGTPGAALREHGIFSASSAGVLWDRTVYAAITLSSGDGLQTTYDMTASANG